MKKISKEELKAKFIVYIQKGGKESVNSFCKDTGTARQTVYNNTTPEERAEWVEIAKGHRAVVLEKATEKASDKIAEKVAIAQVDIWAKSFKETREIATTARRSIGSAINKLTKALPEHDPQNQDEANQHATMSIQLVDAVQKGMKALEDILKIESKTTTTAKPITADQREKIDIAILTAKGAIEDKANDGTDKQRIANRIDERMERKKKERSNKGLRAVK
jgi:hypothetical protein